MDLLSSSRRHPSAVVVGAGRGAGLPGDGGRRAGRVAFEILGIVVLVLAVFSVRSTPGLTWVSIGLGIPRWCCRWST